MLIDGVAMRINGCDDNDVIDIVFLELKEKVQGIDFVAPIDEKEV